MQHFICSRLHFIVAKRNVTIRKLCDEGNKAEQAVSIKEEKATMSLRKSFYQQLVFRGVMTFIVLLQVFQLLDSKRYF